MRSKVRSGWQTILLCVLLLGVSTRASSARATDTPDLVIYTYDSLVAKGGLGPEIFPLFEKKFGCKLKVASVGDGGQLLSRLQLDAERGKPTAHLVLGIDQILWPRAKPWLESWGTWSPAGYAKLKKELKVEPGFLPFDYGVFAFIADSEALRTAKISAPLRLNELLHPRWRRNIILQDPRTSTPGLAFVLYAEAVTDDVAKFWSAFRAQWLTLAPGWSQAYGLFLKKEAPIVWSYVTSQAYHEEQGDRARRYQALLFEEGQPIQVEGAALVKRADLTPAQEKLRRAFLEFLLTAEVQERVPLKNWMFPVVEGVKLPESFRNLPAVKKLVSLPSDPEKVKSSLTKWTRAVEAVQ